VNGGGASLAAAFEAVADRESGRIAVLSGDGEVTYGELDCRANRVAHALLREGAPEEVPVLLLLEPSVALVTALLGVLKAGSSALVRCARRAPAERS